VGFVEGRTSRSRIGVSPVVAEALLISVAVAIGIALLLVSQSWASVTNAKSVEQTNREVAQQWSLLLVEHAFISADGSATVYVSNPGKYQLVILRCVVYQKGYSPPAVPFSEIGRVPADMRQVVPLTCPVYGSGQSYVVEVFAIPNHLYDPREPLTNAQYGVTVRYDLHHLQR
jgi:archaellum component FlaF (FlaF/FlaG flagellin family)